MKRALILSAAALMAFAFQANAQDAEALAKKSTCLNCHAPDTKKVGPSMKDIAAKNKGANVDKVVTNLKAKPIHQAASKNTNDEDMKKIVSWMLTK